MWQSRNHDTVSCLLVQSIVSGAPLPWAWLWHCQKGWKCLWRKELDLSQESSNMSIPCDPVHWLLGICLKEINKNADEDL